MDSELDTDASPFILDVNPQFYRSQFFTLPIASETKVAYI